MFWEILEGILGEILSIIGSSLMQINAACTFYAWTLEIIKI